MITVQLTQKESDLLKDLKSQEKLCADKYTKHASCAHDTQLKKLFSQIAQVEQQHLDSITQIESGAIPRFNSISFGQPSFTATYGAGENTEKQDDCYLCSDVLAGEKHVSQMYDTCIFELKEETLRKALNHIQKEEQSNGKMIYDYMQTNSMYS